MEKIDLSNQQLQDLENQIRRANERLQFTNQLLESKEQQGSHEAELDRQQSREDLRKEKALLMKSILELKQEESQLETKEESNLQLLEQNYKELKADIDELQVTS